ncbi:MAG: InlB B-repeat-containing protein [Clostridia bacterium]|nr:InlB B-repeat-containing protein [Clostridia bacterium]
MSEKNSITIAPISSSKSKSSTKAWTLELTADTIVNAGVHNKIYKYSRITNVTNEIHWKSEDIWNSDGSCTLKIGGSNIETTKAHKTWVTNTRGGLQGYFQSETANAGVPTGTIQLNFSSTNSRKFEIDSWKLTYEYYLPVFVVSLSAGTGGTVSGAGTYDVGTNATITATPASGYHFVKWSDGNINASRTVTVANGSQTAFSTQLSYSAVFEKDRVPCTITYDGNGATGGSVAPQSGYVGESLALLTNSFINEYSVWLKFNPTGYLDGNLVSGYEMVSYSDFQGWYTKLEGGTKIGDGGANYTPTGNITLYAHWGNHKPIDLLMPTRDGYNFLGWYNAAEGGTKVGDGGEDYTPTGNITLYAHWEEIIIPPEITSATITYGGAQVSAQNKVPTGEGYLIAVGIK